jgi:hypothetical protein
MNYLTDYLDNILEDKDIDISDVKLEKSRDNRNIFKVKYNENFRYIGSKYNTGKDIKNFISKFKDIKIDTLLIVFGIGAGEHILELMKILNDFNRLLIVEPDVRVLKAFLNLENAEIILKDNRISIIKMDKENLSYLLNKFIENEGNFNNFVYSVYSNYDKLYESEYMFFLKKFKDVLRLYESNMATEYLLNKKFMNTYLNNIKYISESYMINKFKDKFRGYTAIVVSAGPSLDKNISKLKNLDDNAVIICGNRTLAPLVKLGIKPHFMCSIDCSNLIYNMTKDYLNEDIPLVFTETTNSCLIEGQTGKKIFFRYAATKTDIEDIVGENIDNIYFGGSVAHNCMDFARYLGCSTIIFVGQDLAYTDNESHAKSTSIDEDEEMNEDERFIKVKDINGKDIYTTRALDGFRYSFERYIKLHENIDFIDATEGGVKIEGTSIMTLEETINKYTCKKGIKEIMSTLFSESIGRNIEKIRENIETDLNELIDIKAELKNIRKNIEDAIKSNKISKIRHINHKISEINKMIEDSHGGAFIDFLIQDIMNRGAVYFRYEKSNIEIENAKNILEAFKKLYMDIIEAIEYILPKIEECVKNL